MPALPSRESLLQRILSGTVADSEQLILDIFAYQSALNPIYKRYLDLIGFDPGAMLSLDSIPYLPIEVFKYDPVQSGNWKPEALFESSGTTGANTSRHAVRSLALYDELAIRNFESVFGPLENSVVLGLLPSYIERPNASLVHMVRRFMERSANPESRFLATQYHELPAAVKRLKDKGARIILFGVTFALLELAGIGTIDLGEVLIIETGGMKGRGRELTRYELHTLLKSAFSAGHIASEYGMTELLSQAYAPADGLFHPGSGMRVSCRQINDPFAREENGRIGLLNIIDLANLDTCSFIATDDLGKVYADGGFEVLGRLDHSDIRGCNLLVSL